MKINSPKDDAVLIFGNDRVEDISDEDDITEVSAEVSDN